MVMQSAFFHLAKVISDEDAETSRALAWMIQFEQAGKNWGKKSDDE